MKDIKPVEKNKINGYFWVFGGLLCILLISIMARNINRHFTGLHSWGDAHGPVHARVNLKYGLRYTKGFATKAFGEPPPEKPSRYLNHPQLPALINTAFMAVFGINRWALRAENLIATAITLLLLLKILRRLLDEKTALLAGLFFCLFPLIGYFGVNMWLYPLSFCSIWCYLVTIKALKDGPPPKTIHKLGLAAGLFFALQVSWEGFFFAMAIGLHYVARCISRRQLPDWTLLAILAVAPLSSSVLDLVILTAGREWDYKWITELYKWRAGAGEMAKHDWGKWFARLWEYAVTNFSLPVLIIAIVYLTFGQLFVFMADTTKKTPAEKVRRFPHFWFFIMPAIFQLFLLKGCLWKHQTWERPLMLPVAISAALGIMLLSDILGRIRPLFAKIATVALLLIITISCAKGLNYYYSIHHFSPEKVKLFTMLNERIPPDKMLLSFESLKVEQHSAKGAFYRPEIAWYLDREVVQATTLSEIQKYAQTGKFPYYLMPATYYNRETSEYLTKLSNELQQRYKMTYIPPDPGGPSQAPMLPYLIFDLNSKGPDS